MKKPNVPQVHPVEYIPDPAFSSFSLPPTNIQQKTKGGAVPKQKDQAKQKERGRGDKTKNKPKGQDNSNGSLQTKKKQNDEKNIRSRSKSTKRFFFVEQWPKGKRYLNKIWQCTHC